MSSAPTPQQMAWLDPIRRHPLVAFFALAFGLAWAILVPMTLASHGLVPFPGGNEALPLLIFMGYGPTIAAILVSAAVGGRAGVNALLKRLLIWRVGWRWWAAAIFLNGAIILGALSLYGLTGHAVPPLPAVGPALLLDIVVTFLLVGLINGEEIGWRGFALPRLQERYGVPATVGVLGVMTALFHLPIFFTNGASAAGGQVGMAFLPFLVGLVLAAFLYVWLYRHTRGSLLIATAFHASANTWTQILPFPSSSESFMWLMTGAQLVAVTIVLVVGGTGWLAHRLAPSAAAAPAAV
jgi:membrane protease YdiL (CAAX protease family)